MTAHATSAGSIARLGVLRRRRHAALAGIIASGVGATTPGSPEDRNEHTTDAIEADGLPRFDGRYGQV